MRENVLFEFSNLLLLHLALLPDHFQLSLLRFDNLLQLEHFGVVCSFQCQFVTKRLNLGPQDHYLSFKPVALQQLIESVSCAPDILLGLGALKAHSSCATKVALRTSIHSS